MSLPKDPTKHAAYIQSLHDAKIGGTHPSYLRRVSRICKQCGKEFFVKQSRIDDGRGIFCSRGCFGKWQTENKSGANSHNFGLVRTDATRYLQSKAKLGKKRGL